MGKAAKWFRSLFGLKKSSPEPSLHGSKLSKEKRRWTFAKSQNHHYQHDISKEGVSVSPYSNDTVLLSSSYPAADPDKHAIAVAAATAAVAEAAVAAANAAASVVRLTSNSGRCNSGDQVVRTSRTRSATYHRWTAASAALRIQSTFRGYLARRALRALKALVKLQALVRGYIVRKRNADLMRRMQAMLRAQAQACAGRVLQSESSQSSCKSSHHHHPGPATPEKFEHVVRSRSTRHEQSSLLRRNGSKSSSRRNADHSQLGIYWSDPRLNEELWGHRGYPPSVGTGTVDDEKSDKILEVDTGKPHYSTKRRSLFQPPHQALSSDQQSHSFTTSKDSATHHTAPSLSNLSSCEVQSLVALNFSHDVEEASFCTAENSPQYHSASFRGGNSRKGPFTPTKSDSSRSYMSGYSDHPNYMAFTESAKAKLRSLSAPKQRLYYEMSGSTKRYSNHGFGDSRSSSSQRISNLHANFTSKAYPGSGRLDRLGMPMRGDPFEATSAYRH